MLTINELTDEQKELIKQVSLGKNVLVDACIGSGKTTAIQVLCNEFRDKKILYLTYNRLLKLDAKNKIKSPNTTVTNYHGFASSILSKERIRCGVSDLIQVFIERMPFIPHYDMLVIDEYQDIDLEISQLLEYIKEYSYNLQIVAVGDMKQKIYDKTTLQVLPFISQFLGDHVLLNFTNCFRLSPEYAAELGDIWQKQIIGVNNNCHIYHIPLKEITKFLAAQNPSDILCLGSRTGAMAWVLNTLEKYYSDKFNKSTVYASIKDEEGGATLPSDKDAIFTTYDASKGLERKICVIFDYTEEYWGIRMDMPMTDYKILRNIFCVAASRGKEKIIFVQDLYKVQRDKEHFLKKKTLSTPVATNLSFDDFEISTMFDFKHKEHIEECYKMLSINKIEIPDKTVIDIRNSDGLIDLSPCIGRYQEAMFFRNYDIDAEIDYVIFSNNDRPPLKCKENMDLEDKILYLTAYETYQDRYVTQVVKPIVNVDHIGYLKERLSTFLTPDDNVQVLGSLIVMNDNKVPYFFIDGKCDVLTDEYVYELKFVSELKHEHFLQLACYMVALGMENGRLWNTKKNQMYEITIPQKTIFMKKVVKAITKGAVENCLIGRGAKTRSERQMIKDDLLGMKGNNG